MKFEHNICGFFYVSGFYNGKCWLPREGALLGLTALSVFNLDHGQKLDCLPGTAKSNAMMTMERIGMSFEPPPKSIAVNLLSYYSHSSTNLILIKISCWWHVNILKLN